MGTVLGSAVITSASILLNDATNTHWLVDELLGYLTEGQRTAATLNPTLYVRNTDVVLVKGTKQVLPADCKKLLDMPRNTDGYVIQAIPRQSLDSQVPDWHAQSRADKRVMHYCYTPSDPKVVYVFPASPGGNSVEMVYQASPPPATLNGPIALDDNYAGALVDFVLFRATTKDHEDAGSINTAALHYQSFVAAVTGAAPAAPA